MSILSNKAKYALKALIYLAEQPNDKLTLSAEIAETQNIPKKFLDAILLEMRNSGLLHSRKGKGGGYSLAMSRDDISIGTVIRQIDGPLAPLRCVSRTAYRRCDDCFDESTCLVRKLMAQVAESVVSILMSYSLADLVALRQPLEPYLNYDI